MEKYKTYRCNEKRMHFTATIKIPAGFVITSLNNYAIDLVMDKSDLHETKIRDIRPSFITTGNRQSRRDSALSCFSTVNRFNLHGSIEYNVVARGFRPAKFLLGERVTTFTAHDTLAVDMNLGYGCYESVLSDGLLDQFDVYVIKHTEFVINEKGQQIFYYRKNPSPFFNALRAACCTQVIHVPYTLIITPKILMKFMDDCNREGLQNREKTYSADIR